MSRPDHETPPPDIKETVCQEADRLVGSDRNDAYGHPRYDFARIGALWHEAFGWEVQPADVALAMVLVKISRELHRHKRDNLVDIAGYARTIEMIYDEG